jgi:hypothetical protein
MAPVFDARNLISLLTPDKLTRPSRHTRSAAATSSNSISPLAGLFVSQVANSRVRQSALVLSWSYQIRRAQRSLWIVVRSSLCASRKFTSRNPRVRHQRRLLCGTTPNQVPAGPRERPAGAPSHVVMM